MRTYKAYLKTLQVGYNGKLVTLVFNDMQKTNDGRIVCKAAFASEEDIPALKKTGLEFTLCDLEKEIALGVITEVLENPEN